MDQLLFIYRNALWISAPVFFLFFVLLGMCIKGLLQTIRHARLFSVPLLAQQHIEFSEAGKVVLCLEGPLLSRRFARLAYELVGPDGMAVKSRKALLRMRTTGATSTRMELQVYEITHPGRHLFRINGLERESTSDVENQLVFTRPHLGRTLFFVVGIVLSGVCLIGSIVLFFLRLSMSEATG